MRRKTLLREVEKRHTTPLSSPGLTGRSSNHRPGVLDCPVKPGNDTAKAAASHLFGFLTPLVPLAFMGVEQSFAQADRFWSYLDQFVVLDVGERLLKHHSDR